MEYMERLLNPNLGLALPVGDPSSWQPYAVEDCTSLEQEAGLGEDPLTDMEMAVAFGQWYTRSVCGLELSARIMPM